MDGSNHKTVDPRRWHQRRARTREREPSLLDVISALRDAEQALAAYLDSPLSPVTPEDQAFFTRQLQQMRRMQVLTCKTAALRAAPCSEASVAPLPTAKVGRA